VGWVIVVGHTKKIQIANILEIETGFLKIKHFTSYIVFKCLY